MQKVRFLYNPWAGETIISEWLDDIISIYQSRGFLMEVYRLSFNEKDEKMAVGGLDDSYNHILIAGGDGTVNYIINMMKRYAVDVTVAILPTGTSNDFAKMLGLKDDVGVACRQILNGVVREIDLGKANDRYFINVFSCGLFTDVSQKTPTFLKNNFGKLAYYFSGLTELPAFRKMHISIKSEEVSFDGSTLIFFVFNGRTAGQFKLAYKSEIDDGLLDVLIVKGDNHIETMGTILHFLKRAPAKYPAGIVHFKTKKLTVHSNKDETTDIDGQPGPALPVTITCEEKAIRIICPNGLEKSRRYGISKSADKK